MQRRTKGQKRNAGTNSKAGRAKQAVRDHSTEVDYNTSAGLLTFDVEFTPTPTGARVTTRP